MKAREEGLLTTLLSFGASPTSFPQHNYSRRDCCGGSCAVAWLVPRSGCAASVSVGVGSHRPVSGCMLARRRASSLRSSVAFWGISRSRASSHLSADSPLIWLPSRLVLSAVVWSRDEKSSSKSVCPLSVCPDLLCLESRKRAPQTTQKAVCFRRCLQGLFGEVNTLRLTRASCGVKGERKVQGEKFERYTMCDS